MILAPPASSKLTQDGTKPGQDSLRSTQDGSKTVLKSVFVIVSNRPRFGVVWGSFWDRFWLPLASPNASLLAPFWRPKSIKNRSEIGLRLKVVPRSPQERPRPSQDAPGSPPDTPRTLQDAFQTPPGRPQTPSQTPRMNQKAFPKHVAQ